MGKLLSRDSNTKLIKTAKGAELPVVLAGLSMMPTLELCPNSIRAKCLDMCLKIAVFPRYTTQLIKRDSVRLTGFCLIVKGSCNSYTKN